MAEESKTSESDYVHMNAGVGPGVTNPGTAPTIAGLDDPNLSQEDRDLRLAIALQQQENAAAYDAHKKRHDASVAANTNRTTRSNVHSRLAQVRKKDHGMLVVPDEYTTENAYKKGDSEYVSPSADSGAVISAATANGALPQEIADLKIALDVQKVEQTGAGTAQTMNKILKEEKEDSASNDMRTARSGKAAFHPVRAKK
mmetsp:Transcript_36083/g.87095  ORF Transcript_36083/g.87095 Transcript_36083/m.87095 type:complete len:200 (-) Transcript_36083:91-690(-)|eukprot:CAMPEP_0181116042 /NCGR_PEP_ID=MMETSP1071-20121207/21743_1 /TAXON_ID=35127 /ORGANISM="Thalassiosira sp., Strain NH16" /LENGTH=199 /DNA_ID=CAMNT_0023200267 /DNA_START=8 /DNA_END=607 /DNA_ORIENTATION=-